MVVIYARPPPSPSRKLAQFEDQMDEMAECVRKFPLCPVIAAGDFNAKVRSWGSRYMDARGEALEDWAAAANMSLLNKDRVASVYGGRKSLLWISHGPPLLL